VNEPSVFLKEVGYSFLSFPEHIYNKSKKSDSIKFGVNTVPDPLSRNLGPKAFQILDPYAEEF
jgi:hypothetical protein